MRAGGCGLVFRVRRSDVASIEIYLTQWCPYCAMARRLLAGKGRGWSEIDVEAEPGRRAEMVERAGRRSVPQIFIGGRHVGGFDDLQALDEAGQLDALLDA
jgi:glutaredoxin 3